LERQPRPNFLEVCSGGLGITAYIYNALFGHFFYYNWLDALPIAFGNYGSTLLTNFFVIGSASRSTYFNMSRFDARLCLEFGQASPVIYLWFVSLPIASGNYGSTGEQLLNCVCYNIFMDNLDLAQYIEQARKSGMSDGDIKQGLLQSGWEENDINQEMSKPSAAVPPPPRPKRIISNPPAVIFAVIFVAVLGYIGAAYYLANYGATSLWPFEASGPVPAFTPQPSLTPTPTQNPESPYESLKYLKVNDVIEGMKVVSIEKFDEARPFGPENAKIVFGRVKRLTGDFEYLDSLCFFADLKISPLPLSDLLNKNGLVCFKNKEAAAEKFNIKPGDKGSATIEIDQYTTMSCGSCRDAPLAHLVNVIEVNK
jgi:hypothetical protein